MPGGRRPKQGFGGGRTKSHAKRMTYRKGYWKDVKQRQKANQTDDQIDTNEPIIKAPELEDKYNITNKVGNGGYGTVYKAINLSTNGIVAIKRIKSPNIQLKYQSHHPCIEGEILFKFRSCKYFPTMREILLDKTTGTYSIIMDYFEHDPFYKYNKILN
eukprot:253824_1